MVNAPAAKRLAPILGELVPSLLKSRIPSGPGPSMTITPGFVAFDLIGHDGGVSRGKFCFTTHFRWKYSSHRCYASPLPTARTGSLSPFASFSKAARTIVSVWTRCSSSASEAAFASPVRNASRRSAWARPRRVGSLGRATSRSNA